MKIVRKIIEIDEDLCNGCGQCVTGCAEGALQIVDGKARVVSETFCDGLGACIGECPTGALKIVEREASPFDEEATKQHLKQKEAPVMACGCPSSNIETFGTISPCEAANRPTDIGKEGMEGLSSPSSLTHWPVQIRLVPPTAPFLKGADLLVIADCTAVAFPSLQDLIKGKIVMMGCPKFDDAQSYVDKFADIFRTAGVRSLTTVVMEVPCCAGLPLIVRRAMAASKCDVPMEEIVISTRGDILKRS